MILDDLKNSARYEALNPLFKRAFEWIRSTDIAALPEGRHLIEGDDLFVNLQHRPLRSVEEIPVEVHDRYTDIQVVLDGSETYGWIDRADCRRPQGEMDTERDVRFYDDRPEVFFTLRAGQMAIFFPEDGHAPMIGQGETYKCIVKVRNR